MLETIQIRRTSVEEYAKDLPHLLADLKSRRIVAVIELESEKAATLCYEGAAGGFVRVQGSLSLLVRYQKLRGIQNLIQH